MSRQLGRSTKAYFVRRGAWQGSLSRPSIDERRGNASAQTIGRGRAEEPIIV
jgi:hypothetical protein